MNKILLKVLLLIVFSVTFFQLVIYYLYPHLQEDEYHIYQYKKDFFQNGEKKQKDFEQLVLGDCVGMTSVNPKFLDKSTVNLSLAGTTPLEVYFLLRKYLEHNPVPKKVFLILATNQFVALDQFFENAISLKMLNRDDIDEIAVTFDRLDFHYPGPFVFQGFKNQYLNKVGEYLPTKAKLLIDFYAGKYSLDPNNINRLKHCLFDLCFTKNRFDFYAFTKKHEGFYQYQNKEDPDQLYQQYGDWGKFEVSAVMNHYFEKTIQLALQNNIKLVYHHPPVTKNNFNKTSDHHTNQVTRYMKGIQEKYPEALFFYRPPLYTSDYFSSNIYPNHKGAEQFSRYLNEI